jgi:peptidoglycan/LPS O-acetylase OafA/YrhL
VAVLLVIVNHLSPSLLPGGFLGVDVFFVLSGFVITRTLAARTAPAGKALAPGAFLLDFYRRRVQRLVPALLACVLITALLSCLVIPDPAPALRTGLAALFGVSNLQLQAASTDYFSSEAALNPFTQTWSLGVEEQFYLVYPLLALLLGVGRSRGRLPRRFLLTLLAIAVLSLGAFLVAGRTDPSAAYLLTHLRLWELAGGCLLVPLEPRAARWTAGRAGRRRLAWAGGVALIALLGLGAVPERGLVGSTPAAVLATMVLITALQPGLPIQRGLAHPWLRHIGQISYPLYLWHWSVISLARWSVGTEGRVVPVLLLVMLGAAEASHRWLETPLRRGVWPGGAGGTLLLGLAVNGLAAGGLALLGPGDLGRRLYAGSPTASLTEGRRRQRLEGTRLNSDTCLLTRSATVDRQAFEALSRACSSAPLGSNGPPRLFVLGDSHAAALLPLANQLHAEGVPISQLSKAGCPFPATAGGHALAGCQDLQGRVARLVLERGRHGDHVLISNYLLSHLGNDAKSRNDFLDSRGTPIEGTTRKRRLYLDALADFSAAARRHGLTVTLVGAGPRLARRDLCLPEWFRSGRTMRSCEAAFARDQAAARRLNRRLQAGLPPGVAFLDPLQQLCPQGCDRHAMRRLLLDDDHLSEEAVLRLLPELRRRLTPPPAPSEARLAR